MRFTNALCVIGIITSSAQAAVPGAQDAVKEIGVALGWRLKPAAVEERCRSVDPEGAKARAEALHLWQSRNSRQIQAVDARVAEVAPMLDDSQADLAAVISSHVRKMILESIFADKTPDQTAAICKQLTDPKQTLWTSNGMPSVQESLAALYDWKIARSAK